MPSEILEKDLLHVEIFLIAFKNSFPHSKYLNFDRISILLYLLTVAIC